MTARQKTAGDLEREPLLDAGRTTTGSRDLDSFPVYSLTLTLRDLIDKAVDTTLTWEQLRSPQLNSFLVKPLQLKCKELRSRAIVFCLLVNCAQYREEANEDSVRAGAKLTRGLVCELLAVKLLKDFSPRELIDVLCFDFWPLQGDPNQIRRTPHRSQRISALELAIKSIAKKFLSTPIVVQVLENVWKGNIVFYGASDKDALFLPHGLRKAATLYDAREASLFKLSRLRVPRYRHWMQTISFGILLCLVIAVLFERQLDIRPLEIVMVVYAVGFMVDELVGLNSSGSTLFLSNLWNAFDLLTLLFFIAFFVLRVYGLFHWIGTDMEYFAYDILAVNTIFLVPRLFSALDHTRQFSQMLIAFQRMAVDLVTSLIFILMFIAGFFLALSLAFARNLYSAQEVAFKLLQLIFGFSPAAWSLLPEVNWIGKILLITFMINTNYLVVTILVSVLSTTFANVIANAHEEHQYLFALNTILAVKSDALFFYQAPFNLIEWLLSPLVLVMSRPRWIRLNRYFIKFLHLPVLAAIFLYERFFLGSRSFMPADMLLTRQVSIETMQGGGFDITTGNRKSSLNFFSRRRESDAAQQFSHSALAQVFANQHGGSVAKRKQPTGYFATPRAGVASPRRGPPATATGVEPAQNPRTNDWLAQLDGSAALSPNAAPSIVPDDVSESRLPAAHYAPMIRPPVRRGNTTTGIVQRERRPPVRRDTIDEDYETAPPQNRVDNGNSPTIRFARAANQRYQKRSQTVDPAAQLRERRESSDEADSENDGAAVVDEDSDAEPTARRNSGAISGHSRNESVQTVRPRGIGANGPRRPPPGPTHRDSSEWITSAAEDDGAYERAARLGRSVSATRSYPSRTPSGYAGDLHTTAVTPGGVDIVGQRPQSRRASDAAADAEYAAGGANLLSTSLATQLAAHAAAGMRAHYGRIDDDAVTQSGGSTQVNVAQRMLLNRVEGIELGVRGGAARMQRLESQLADVLRELRKQSHDHHRVFHHRTASSNAHVGSLDRSNASGSAGNATPRASRRTSRRDSLSKTPSATNTGAAPAPDAVPRDESRASAAPSLGVD